MTHHLPSERFASDMALLPDAPRPSLQDLKPIDLRSPDVMSIAELTAWTQIGKNSIPRLLKHFAIREVTGKTSHLRFSTHDIMRRIVGVRPETPGELYQLLMPLQPALWVAAITGTSRSTLSAHARNPHLDFPSPINLLTTTSGQAAPRGRRWIPAQIEAHIRGEIIPFLAQKSTSPEPAHTPSRNVFAAICASNAEGSR